MPAIGFLVATAYMPWFIDSSSGAKWAVLSILLPLALLRRPTGLPWPLWAFLAWCGLTLLWGPPRDGLMAFWHFILLAMAFALGSGLNEREWKHTAYAFAGGVMVSVLLAIPWLWGIEWPAQAVPPAGLFMNRNYLGEASVMVMGLWFWPLALLVSPGLFLTASTGSFLGAWCILACRFRRFGLVSGLLGLIFLAWLLPQKDTTEIRLAYWSNSVMAFIDKPQGHGLGSFWTVYPFYNDAFMKTPWEGGYNEHQRPRFAHNDFLTLLVETGLPGVLLLGLVFFRCLQIPNRPEKYVLVAFLGLGLTAFPLYNPATGFLGFLAAGRLYRLWLDLRRPAEPGTGQLS